MDLLDRLLGHDEWTTQKLLEICGPLSQEELDREFDIGHRTLRATLNHIIHNVEVWSSLIAGEQCASQSDLTMPGMGRRLQVAHARLQTCARRIADEHAWDETWIDTLENPPQKKSYGAAIAHIITHSMHHRAQLLYMLRLSGIADCPEGDVFSWEQRP